MEKKKHVIEKPDSDDQLPAAILAKIAELIKAGWKREHLLITESGDVIIDTEAYDHEQLMRSMYPDKPREDYMYVTYPERIVCEE